VEAAEPLVRWRQGVGLPDPSATLPRHAADGRRCVSALARQARRRRRGGWEEGMGGGGVNWGGGGGFVGNGEGGVEGGWGVGGARRQKPGGPV
jgi:hypothetical protein